MGCVYKKQGGEKLREYLKQIAVRANEATTDTCHLSLFVTRPCNPNAAELPEC